MTTITLITDLVTHCSKYVTQGLLGFLMEIMSRYECSSWFLSPNTSSLRRIFQETRGYDGYIFLSKLQQSGGILKMLSVLYGSALLGDSYDQVMGPTSTQSSRSFYSASVIRHFLSRLRYPRPFTSSYR